LTDKSTRQNKKTKFPVKFCPKCGSSDVFWTQGLPQLWSLWQYQNCGYRGAFILEDGNLSKKLQEKWKNIHLKR
jgi:predicted RNA-binding Zn-ribbon protein involved in translation (DUF1610 family)